MAVNCLWGDTFVRGPPSRPSCSGRDHANVASWKASPHALVSRSRAGVVAYAAEGALSLQLTTERAPPTARVRVQEIDDYQLEQPAPGSNPGNRPLKINMDLRLVGTAASAGGELSGVFIAYFGRFIPAPAWFSHYTSGMW